MCKTPRALLLVFAFLLAPVCLSAQDDFLSFGDGIFDDGSNFPVLTGEPRDYRLAGEEEPEVAEEAESPEAVKTTEKKKFRFNNRMVELSVANTGLDFSNNFIAAADIIKDPFYLLKNINKITQNPGLVWRDPIVVNLDHFFNGFQFNFGASFKPFSINFNWKDEWGFGFDVAHIDITGNLSLSGNLATLSAAKGDEFGVGGAVFVEAGIPIFFRYNDFKIKIRPAGYIPVIYTEPKVTYTYTETANGIRYEIDYDMQIYTLVSMEGIDGGIDVITQRFTDNVQNVFKNNLGFDFGLNVEYPLLYNLDIGVNMVNIPFPFATARLNHYLHYQGYMWADTSGLDIGELIDDGSGNPPDFEDLRGTVYDYSDEFGYKINKKGKKIYRPFTMLFYGNYRPFASHFLTLIPSLGFSINALYPQIAAIEGGLSVRLDVANMFITVLGVNYNDRRWKNNIDFILNLRAFEFDIGISLQSQDFVRSWQGAGLGLNLGIKFGW